jgi:hypothetical protein
MSGCYLMSDGTLIVDVGQDSSPASLSPTSPCGMAQAALVVKVPEEIISTTLPETI